MTNECNYNNIGMESSTSIPSITGGETRTNLIINYLPQTLTDQEFYKIFIVIGPIKNCRIMKDLKAASRQDGSQPNQTGYSFGFGFVEYHKPEDAAKAILQLNNLPVQHKRIKVSYARPPGEDIKETNLYIQNIPRSYTLDQLEDLFTPYGHIVQKNLLKDKVTGLPRGVGFVRYDKKSEAELAIAQMNGVIPDGGNDPLVVKVAEEHGKMKAAYYAGYHAGLQNNRGPFRGRGRGNFNSRGGMGYNRGGFNNAGKLVPERSNNRFNPMANQISQAYGSQEASINEGVFSASAEYVDAPYNTGSYGGGGGAGAFITGPGAYASSRGVQGRGAYGRGRGAYGSSGEAFYRGNGPRSWGFRGHSAS